MAAKTYALKSDYALICDMRLITREYGSVSGRIEVGVEHSSIHSGCVVTKYRPVNGHMA